MVLKLKFEPFKDVNNISPREAKTCSHLDTSRSRVTKRLSKLKIDQSLISKADRFDQFDPSIVLAQKKYLKTL